MDPVSIAIAQGFTRARGRDRAAAKSPVDTPAGFSWTTHPLVGKLFVDQHGVFSSTLDPTTLKAPSGTTYWVDLNLGQESNDGLTPGTSLQRIYTALGKPGAGTIMVKGNGVAYPYYRARGMSGIALTRNVNIIGYGGDVYITTHDLLTWTLTAGTTKTYEITRSSVGEVVDMIAGGVGVKLLNVTTQALVETTPGSWYTDGTKVFVHPSTSRAADAYIWALLSTINFRNTGDYTTYLEGVKFFGGFECIKITGGSATGAVAVLNNVEAYLALNGYNNIAINGADSVLVNCDSTWSGSDGYGYHLANGKIPHAVEINCRATSCGHSSDDQCSTIHDGGKIIRVQGTYRTATGATVADVNDGTESWNLGCIAEDSASGWNWKCGHSPDATTKMWLHGCSGGRGGYWSGYAEATCQLSTRGTRLERTNVTPTAY